MDSKQIGPLLSAIILNENSSISKKALKKIQLCFQDPKKVNLIYKKIMLKVLQDSQPSDRNLVRAFSLINSNLQTNPPSGELTQKISRFCTLVKHRKSTELVQVIEETKKSLRILLTKQKSKTKNKKDQEKTKDKTKEKTKEKTKKKDQEKPKEKKKEKEKENTKEKTREKTKEKTKKKDQEKHKEKKKEKERKNEKKKEKTKEKEKKTQNDNKKGKEEKKEKQKKKKKKKKIQKESDFYASLLLQPTFGGQFSVQKSKPRSEKSREKIPLNINEPVSSLSTLTYGSVSELLQLVKVQNKQNGGNDGDNEENDGDNVDGGDDDDEGFSSEEESSSTKKTSTVKMKRSRLFQYKHYEEQKPFKFNEKEIDLISQTILKSNQDKTLARKSLSEFWIKIAIDTYLQKDPKEFLNQINSFTSMLNTKQIGPKLMAFNLLFNLLIHSNLIYDLQQLNLNENNKNKEKTNQKQKQKQKEMEKENKTQNLKKLAPINEALFNTLQNMIIALSKTEETSPKVWTAALNCFFFVITQSGKLNLENLLKLDLKVVIIFLKRNERFSDLSIKMLIRILINLIYKSKKKFLDFQPLPESIFGDGNNFDLLVEIYSKTRIFEVRENLFYLFFDNCASELIKNGSINIGVENKKAKIIEEFLSILHLLIRLDFAHHFPRLFLHCGEKIWEQLSNFIFAQQLAREKKLIRIAKRLPKETLSLVFFAFSTMINNHAKIAPKFQNAMQRTLEIKMINVRGIKIIKSLISSKIPEFRKSGKNWLFELMKMCAVKNQKFEGKELIKNLMNSLSSLKNWRARYCYIEIVEKLALFYKANLITKHGKTVKIKEMFKFFNEMCIRILQSQEKHPNNLRYLLVIVIRLIGYDTKNSLSPSLKLNIFQQVLSGEWLCSTFLINQISPQIFQFVLQNLDSKRENSDARCCALLLLSSKHQDEESGIHKIGGIKWLESLINDQDMRFALIAARIAEDWYLTKNAEQYNNYLAQVKKVAKSKKISEIRKNPLLRVKEVLLIKYGKKIINTKTKKKTTKKTTKKSRKK
ncbi:conditional loss-of-growth 1 [Anaeramoeba flamelloides]|uniref:Conditional loss-of-growth 1 n=1 Tax=Anaeramoeba flamelloides TaxID=1746091 RepID=A0ABQ8XXX9_9EUKA|nr:conditional loss-of-growth 1 [Anaeramoeba flamelloides]